MVIVLLTRPRSSRLAGRFCCSTLILAQRHRRRLPTYLPIRQALQPLASAPKCYPPPLPRIASDRHALLSRAQPPPYKALQPQCPSINLTKSGLSSVRTLKPSLIPRASRATRRRPRRTCRLSQLGLLDRRVCSHMKAATEILEGTTASFLVVAIEEDECG